MSPISEAQKRATAKYEAKKYDKPVIRMEKGKKDIVNTHAQEHGESFNGFVNRAIDNQIERDKSMQPADVPEIAIAKSRPEVLAHAEIMGESLPDFVNRAIDVTMQRDNISVQLAKKSGAGKDNNVDK